MSNSHHTTERVPFAPAYELLWRYKRSVFVSPEFGLAVIIALAFWAAYTPGAANGSAEQLLLAEIAIVVALLGVILGAMAVFLATLDKSFLGFLAGPDELGLEEDFFQFWLTALLAVATAVADVFGVVLVRAAADHGLVITVNVGHTSMTMTVDERAILAVATFTFLWTLLSIFGLVRYLATIAMIRARFQRITEPPTTATMSSSSPAEDVRAEAR